MTDHTAKFISEGRASLGIELGSTRIKAVLVDDTHRAIAQGSHTWENQLCHGLWTYSETAVWEGIQKAYAELADSVESSYGVPLEQLASIGVSAMMHGYMPFDKKGELLAPFRTWRNTNTSEAASMLSELFDFNIPLRWSISHLWQAIIDDEDHVASIDYLTTLAGYVHWKLTGVKVLGVGDASGMLPIDEHTLYYRRDFIEAFDAMAASRGFHKSLSEILPEVKNAGEPAGRLSAEGALMLDPSGKLKPGVPFCAPEGDAGTGMVATNAVRPRTGNVSAGTSSFSMIVLDKDLHDRYDIIDIVTTPTGHPVAMVHCNNCTSDLNAWVSIFKEYTSLLGVEADTDTIYGLLYRKALDGDSDCGGLLAFNFFSGEPVVGLPEGRPMFIRSVTDKFNLANFMRAHLHASVAALKAGNDVLFKKEEVEVDRLTGHGGLFKTPGVGQRILAAALGTPITVMETAGEGGAWGMALLASYLVNNPTGRSLEDWLDQEVFKGSRGVEIAPSEEEKNGFKSYLDKYEKALSVEKAAVEVI